MVDVGPRLANDLKELSYKAEAISSGAEQSLGAGRLLNLTMH